MADNGSLDSLVLEIGGTSEKANDSISKVIGSLRSMARAVGTVVPALRSLNSELKTLAGYGRIKLPSLSSDGGSKGAASAVKAKEKEFKATASILKEYKNMNLASFKSWMYGPNPLPKIDNMTGSSQGMLSEEENRRRNPQWYHDPEKQRTEAMQNLRDNGGVADWAKENQAATQSFNQLADSLGNVVPASKSTTSALKDVDKELKQKKTDCTQAKSGLTSTSQALHESGEEAEHSVTILERLGVTLNRIGRMASTMLIRTAMKSLMKGFSQSWQAAYEFSNQMHGSFAKSVDAARTIMADTTTTLIQTFAPAFEAMVPVFYVISNAIQYLCQGLQYLMSLLGLTSDLMGKAASKINKYYSQSDKNKNKNKNTLASWDQINVIQSKSGSGGSGSGSTYKPGSLKRLISSEISAVMSVIVGEGLLALGMILAVTGHVGLGISLMAIGAAAIAKPMFADWNTLPDQIKQTIATITSIAATASLALGLILAFNGHVGLGIGLIAIGAANMAATVAVAWGEEVTSGVKKTVTDIMLIAGASMVALGLILLCTGVGTGLGIGMIIAGGVSLGAAVALNWDTIPDKVNGIMTTISDWFVQKWEAIKEAVNNAWTAVSKWWDENIVEHFKRDWEQVKTFFENIWGSSETGTGIAGFASQAWNDVSTIWCEEILPEVESTWNSVSTFFQNLWGDSETNTGIAGWASQAWDSVSGWWDENVVANFEKEGVWGGVKGFFEGLWGNSETNTGIAGLAMSAWDTVSGWWDENVTENVKKEGAWGGVKGFFEGIFGNAEAGTGIAGSFKRTWDLISQWWNTNIKTKVEGAWSGINEFFTGLFGDSERGLIGEFNALYAEAAQLWGDIVGNVEAAWKNVSTWFYNNVTMPVGNFFIDCINGIIDGINWLIKRLNTINITIPAVSLPLVGQLWGETKVGIYGIAEIGKLDRLQAITQNADGAYGIPRGDLFIANEAGAELIGTMNGKTTVANQGQIIEGIRSGVRDANAEQNELLRRQNDLLINLIEKSGNIEVTPSASWGKFVQQSNELWGMATGR